MNTQYFLTKLMKKHDLTVDESRVLLEGIIDGSVSSVQAAAVLTALRIKGETADEIVGLVKAMRKHMHSIKTSGVVIDTCGTGGDGKGTLNVSTACALVVSGAGVKVAKHGNRAATSLCGSADVLEKLGVNINLDSRHAEKVLEDVGMVFLFAPLFHPATKNVVSVRKELKVPTVFNFLGPLVNPAGVKRQLIGVPDRAIAKTLAKAATSLGYEHVLFVTSFDGTDEITLTAKTYGIEVKGDAIRDFVIDPSEFGFTYRRSTLRGGNADENAKRIYKLLSGERGQFRDTVIINAAASFYVSGVVSSIGKGIPLAKSSIDLGHGADILTRLVSISNIR